MSSTDQSRVMAHLQPIDAPRCQRCGGRATVTLVNGVNAPIGDYCRHHGSLALRSFKSTGMVSA